MKLRNIILFAASCIIATSCADFLTEKSMNEMEKKETIKDADMAELVLLGAYRSLVEEGTYAANLSYFLNMGTDLSQVEGSSTENFRIVPANAFQSTQAEIQQTWQSLYGGIYRCNDFLERISAVLDGFASESDKERAIVYIAEARALRAMFYFELVRWYGHVPLMTSTAMSDRDPSTFVQADPVDVYKFIEEDLIYAKKTLPWANEDSYRSDNSFRFSRGAAMGLLAKVYATWAGAPLYDVSKWEAAAAVAGDLIKSRRHDLLDNYEDLWFNTCNSKWDPTESLIEISFYSPTASGGNADPIGRIGKWNGVKVYNTKPGRATTSGNVKVVHTFYKEWKENEPTDPRRGLSIAAYSHGYSQNSILYDEDYHVIGKADAKSFNAPFKEVRNKQNYVPGKWDIQKYVTEMNGNIGYLMNNDKSNVNWYFLRYADVLLLYAEALNEVNQGPTDEAYAAINKVRQRAAGSTDTNADRFSGYDSFYMPEGEYNIGTDSAPEMIQCYGGKGKLDDLSGLSYEEFKTAVRQERAYELAFEGHRKQDLIRWGIYTKTVQETYQKLASWWSAGDRQNDPFNYVVAAYTQEGKHELLPIPQREMDLCKANFTQNPNW